MRCIIATVAMAIVLPFLSMFSASADVTPRPKPIKTPVIIVIVQNPISIPGQPRSLTEVPIECVYEPMSNGIYITFTSNIGNVEVIVENTFTGEYVSGSADTVSGQLFVPISGSEGVYTITFITDSGSEYYGSFEL